MKNKILSLVISVLLVASVIPFGAFATSSVSASVLNTQQIRYEGGWNPALYPVDGTLYKDRIAVSKTVSPTEVENYFGITLKVVAKQRVIDQSVDVVVVMDNSNTMNATHENLGVNSPGYRVEDARLTHAKNAVKQFVDKFSAEQNISRDRRFALVTFNSFANTVIPLTTLNTEETATQIKATVEGITAPDDNRVRFTNTEGGLQLAHNLLKESDAVYKYVIFLTDGFPTTYIESEKDSLEQITGYDTFTPGSYDASKINTDGYFADSITEKVCTYGVNYSDKAADKADDIAALIKADNINVFSIGIDVGVQGVSDYVNSSENTSFTTVDRRSDTYVIGDTPESYKAWLRDSIAGGSLIELADKTEKIHRYAQGNSSEQLNTAFSNILRDIELIPAETMQEAYTLDPMSDYVEFLNFYDIEGNPVDAVYNSNTGAEVATFSEETKTIKWWLTNTQSWYIDEIGNYVLTVSYRVRLKNEAENFNPNTAFDTNKTTSLYFKTIDFATGEPLYGDNCIDYPIPQIEGYLGNLVFTKQDGITKAPLSGAEFELSHNVDSCDICHKGKASHEGRAVIETKTAVSDANGVVKFMNLPSGHEYVLSETKAPVGYQTGTSHTVVVSYGKTYLHGEEITDAKTAVVENQKIAPVTAVLSAKKTLVGRELKADEFTFALDGERMNGLDYHERHHTNGDGTVTFDTITFDRTGVFNFAVYEIKGDDPTVIYDDTVYNVEFTVTLSEDNTGYILSTKVNGQDVDTDNAPPAFEFVNTLRAEGVAVIEAEKLLDGSTPEDGQFHFELADEKGNLLQTKENTGKSIVFDENSYNCEGVYNYTITEEHQCTPGQHHINDTHIVFDHTVYNVKVTVTAPDGNGAFNTKVEYFANGVKTDKAVFSNTSRQEAQLQINALKILNGKAPDDSVFNFRLRSISGETVSKAQNNKEGIVTFDNIIYTKPGYYIYILSEDNDKNENINYDEQKYMIFVEVTAPHYGNSYLINLHLSEAGDEVHNVSLITSGKMVTISPEELVFRNETIPAETGPAETTTEPVETTTEPPKTSTQPAETTTEPVIKTEAAETDTNKPEISETEAPENTSTFTEAQDATGATEQKPASPDVPKTGINNNCILLIAALFVLSLGVCITKKSTNKL